MKIIAGFSLKRFQGKLFKKGAGLTMDIRTFFTDKQYREFLRKRWQYRRRKISGGDKNPDKIFYVIRTFSAVGIFSECIASIAELQYCEQKGYVPVISYSLLSTKKRESEDWELFFRQPGGYSIKEVEGSKHIILGDAFQGAKGKPGFDWKNYDIGKDALRWNWLYNRYYRLNERMQKYVSDQMDRLWPAEGKVIGVAIRRGVQRTIALGLGVGNGHFVEYTFEEVLKLVKKKMKEWKYEYIFASSDDEEAVQILKSQFGEKLLYVERERLCLFKDGEPNLMPGELMISEEQKAEEYILEMELLARCDSLIAGKNGGNIWASIRNGGKYEHVICTDKEENRVENTKMAMNNGYYVEIVEDKK